MAAVILAAALAGSGCSRTADVKPSQTETAEPVESEAVPGDSVQPSENPPVILPFPESSKTAEEGGREAGESTAAEEKQELSEDLEYQWIENIIVAADIHYLAPSLTDGGEQFQLMVEHGDGKVVTYIEEITEAFLDEVVSLRPNALVLCGDLTLNGEKESHQELAKKLYRVEEAGVPVLVIPGNHDINNHQAARFEGPAHLPAEYTTPEEFREIYRDFGYDEAVSEDRGSLSYMYQLDENTRFLMLDTCQYRPVAQVGGAITSAGYDWIERQLEQAWDDRMDVIPVAHHNLLDESEIYVDNCTIEHGEQLVNMLEEWDVNVFLSGHLHVQHVKRSEEDRGVWEMVTSSLATPACQYGVLDYRDDGSFTYKTWSLDVEGWARKNGVKEKDLLEFDEFKEPFLRRVFYNQSIAALHEMKGLTAEQKEQMSKLYAELNYHYYQGTAYQVRDMVKQDPVYGLWENEGSLSILGDYVAYIIGDAVRDYNRIQEE